MQFILILLLVSMTDALSAQEGYASVLTGVITSATPGPAGDRAVCSWHYSP